MPKTSPVLTGFSHERDRLTCFFAGWRRGDLGWEVLAADSDCFFLLPPNGGGCGGREWIVGFVNVAVARMGVPAGIVLLIKGSRANIVTVG